MEAETVVQAEILRKPENQRFFVWTSKGLRLVGQPPEEVVEAWASLACVSKRRVRLPFARRA